MNIISSIILGILLFFAVAVGDWIHVPFIATLFAAVLFFSYHKKTLPNEFYVLFPFIAFLATLGSKHIFNYYQNVEWYDNLVHLTTTFVITYFFAFLVNFTALREAKREPLVFLIAIVGLGIALGVFWEIFEWGFDQIIGLEMFKEEGIDDLIMDLIMDTIGAVLAGILIFKSSLQKRPV